MKLIASVAAAVRWLIVPLAGAIALAPVCSAAPPRHEASVVVRPAHRASSAARLVGPPAPRTGAVVPLAGRAGVGIVIGIDPESGQPGALAPEQAARLAATRAAATSHAPPVHHADGRVSMYVGNWMREFSVVRLGPGGRPVFGCVDGRDAATRPGSTTPAPAGAEDR